MQSTYHTTILCSQLDTIDARLCILPGKGTLSSALYMIGPCNGGFSPITNGFNSPYMSRILSINHVQLESGNACRGHGYSRESLPMIETSILFLRVCSLHRTCWCPFTTGLVVWDRHRPHRGIPPNSTYTDLHVSPDSIYYVDGPYRTIWALTDMLII